MASNFVRLGCLALTLTVLGCGETRKTAYLEDQKAAKAPATEEAAGDDLKTQADAAWEGRGEKAQLEEAIKLYEQMIAANPADRDSLARLARGYYFLANGHLSDEAAIIEAYDKGAGYGEQAMATNAAFKKAIADGEPDEKALKLLTKDEAPGLYWAYSNLGKWAVAKGFTTVLKYKNKLKAFVDRVVELDPQFFYGAGDRGLGAFYAKAPSFAGGDLGKAHQHFTRSLEIEPNYLGTKLLIAEYYATKKQDKKLFTKILQEVIDADPSVLPDIVPEQKADQEKAKRLLALVEDKFE